MIEARSRCFILHAVNVDRHVFYAVGELYSESAIQRSILDLLDQLVSISVRVQAVAELLHVGRVAPDLHVLQRLVVKLVAHALRNRDQVA